MSSDTALVSGQGSGIGWQVNLPSFSSLALNLGVAALKQLATAGVSEHTLQCMLMIAEVCPASNEYRRDISKCRQEQRKTAIWMCKIVELGTATNFVADELLKTRAGENVVALMSAVLPVMSEDSCDSMILRLFDASGASSNTTPGFSQLQSLRTILAPLLRNTAFKDKAFQYHSFLKRLLVNNKSLPPTSLDDVYNSIPNGETMVHMIQLLSELVQEGGRKIMAYHGLKGAAWCITYARHVLGLAVCVLRTTVDLVPINGDYKNARVLVYIFEDESRCDILIQGKVTDFFDVKGIELGLRGWTIDTHNTNVLDCYLPPSELVRTRAVDIVASLVHCHTEIVARTIYSLSECSKLEKLGLVRYSVYCLPAVRERASRILRHLGFDSYRKSTTKTGPEILRQYFIRRTLNLSEPKKQYGRQDDKSGYHFAPGPAWLNSPCGTHSSSSELLRLSNNENAAEFNDDDLDQIAFLCRIALAASWLAFTNWDRDLHMISVNFLEGRDDSWKAWLAAKLSFNDPVDYNSVSCSSVQPDVRMVRWSEYPSISTMVRIRDLIELAALFSFDGWRGWNSAFDHDSILAVHHRGFIVAHNSAIQQSLDMEAVYVYFLPGAICVNGERRERIYGYTTVDKGSPSPQHSKDHYQPINICPALSLRSYAQYSGDDVAIHQDVLIEDQVSISSPLTCISAALGSLHVTNGCDHSYYKEFGQLEGSRSLEHQKRIVKQGIFTGDLLRESDGTALTCYLQAVDQNDCGQWVACGLGLNNTDLSILQRNTCLQCTCAMAEEGCHTLEGDRRWGKVCVIPGRLKDEPMD